MSELPPYRIRRFGDGDVLPPEAEEFFANELAYSREPLPEDRPDYGKWRFICVCALTEDGRVLGGLHMDIGPTNFGPLADDLYAIVEAFRVRPECRKKGLKEAILRAAVEAAREAGCAHIQAAVSWNEPEDVRAFKACGFAIADLTGPGERDEYFAMKPLNVPPGSP